jgi:hypothetical protein
LSGNKSIGPVLTRLEMFLAQKPIAYMVSQPRNRLDIGQIMDTGKIFLAKLPEGLLGRENSYLLGTLLISKFHQLAMARQAKNIAARRDFWIYADEFANFITPSMAEILSGARKYCIGLTLAHHELHQLQRSPEVASAVMTHPFTRIVFRVGDDDARKLADGFSFFEANDLKNLETGHAIARVQRSSFDFNLKVILPDQTDEQSAAARRAEVITASRKKYGTPKADVEAMLRQAWDVEQAKPKYAKPERPLTERESLPTKPIDTSISKAVEAPKTSLAPHLTEPGEKPAGETERKPLAPTDNVEDENEHLAIKNRIRTEAETLDFTVSFEELVPSGGRVDVVLRRGKMTVACEVTVTTPVEYEVANVRKCLDAGFERIAVICKNRKKLDRIRDSLAHEIVEDKIHNIGFYAPEQFIAKLHDMAASDQEGGEVERAKPRKREIKLGGPALDENERKERERAMLSDLAALMKRRPAA